MMQLLSAWKESLQLFKPSNFKLFFLVTLKTFVGTLQVWLRYWWWLIGLVIAGSYIMSSILNYLMPISGTWVLSYSPLFVLNSIGVGQRESDLSYNYDFSAFPLIYYVVSLIVLCFFGLLCASLYASVRPSVAIKNWHYFLGYSRHLFYFTCWFLVWNMLTIACFKSGIVFFAELDKHFFGTFFMGITLLNIFFTLMSSVTLFFLIFLLDSDASANQVLLSIRRAVKMVFYNFPFALISMNIVILLYALISGIVALSVFVVGGYLSAECQGLIIDLMLNSLGILFALLLACFFVNYYIKKIHDNYSLYVGN